MTKEGVYFFFQQGSGFLFERSHLLRNKAWRHYRTLEGLRSTAGLFHIKDIPVSWLRNWWTAPWMPMRSARSAIWMETASASSDNRDPDFVKFQFSAFQRSKLLFIRNSFLTKSPRDVGSSGRDTTAAILAVREPGGLQHGAPTNRQRIPSNTPTDGTSPMAKPAVLKNRASPIFAFLTLFSLGRATRRSLIASCCSQVTVNPASRTKSSIAR